jgi:hypothetical protein
MMLDKCAALRRGRVRVQCYVYMHDCHMHDWGVLTNTAALAVAIQYAAMCSVDTLHAHTPHL